MKPVFELCLLLVFLLSACDGGDSNNDPTREVLEIDSFETSDQIISVGGNTTLTAIFSGGTGEIDTGVGRVNSGEAVIVSPSTTTTYTLTVLNNNVESETRQLTIRVVEPPSIESFTAAENALFAGDATLITAVYSNGEGTIDQGIGVADSGEDVDISPSTTTMYTLTVTNEADDSATATVTVSVATEPSIISFTALRSQIAFGESTTLTPIFVGGIGSIDQGVGAVNSGQGIIVTPDVSTTYTLTLTVVDADPIQLDVTIDVIPPPQFSSTIGSPVQDRFDQSATYYRYNNKDYVLIAGGFSGSLQDLVNTAEIYDVETGTFSATTGNMSTVRRGHTATWLNNGMILIAGGENATSSNPNTNTIASAELFDPATQTFTPIGDMNSEHYLHTATLLSDGKVLVAGGYRGTNRGESRISSSDIAEVYDPDSGDNGSFSMISSGMLNAHKKHCAVRLVNDDVLIVDAETQTAEIYEPDNNRFVATAQNPSVADFNYCVLLEDETVFIAGNRTADIFSTVNNGTFTALENPSQNQASTASLLANGKVLLFGSSSELFDPLEQSYSPTYNQSPLLSPTATTLPDGTVFFFGGEFGPSGVVAAGKIYQ